MADSDQPDDNTVSLHKTIISLRSRKICAIGTLSQAFVTRNGDLGFDIDTWEKTVVSWHACGHDWRFLLKQWFNFNFKLYLPI